MSYKVLPLALQMTPQWVGVTHQKRPMDPTTGRAASVDDPKTWGTFEQAIQSGFPHIGFVLTEHDPFTFIDLDFKQGDGPEITKLHAEIVEHADSYTEVSVSGKGTHVLVEGSVGGGYRSEAMRLEIYSTGRMIICTGEELFPGRGAAPRQELLDYLVELIGESRAPSLSGELLSEESNLTDYQVWERAANADNGDKFKALWYGQWRDYIEYQDDHSRADVALLTFLDFYSQDVDQVVRLFKHSALYRPEKGRRGGDGTDYIERSLRYARSRNQADQPPPVDLSAASQWAAQAMQQAAETVPEPSTADIEYPGGLVGEIADYVYRSSFLPVPAVGLTAALASFAAIVGRQYNISGTGLNQYIVLLASTGTGKEGAAAGIDRLFNSVKKHVPIIDDFQGPAQFASGPALVKTVADRPSFVSVIGEFGFTLARLCSPRASSADLTLKQALLDLYQKSGWQSTVKSSAYSDREKNTEIVHAPNVNILGESTQTRFFEGMDENSIADGLVPRFLIIEHTGKRPYSNDFAFFPPPESLTNKLVEAVTVSATMAANQSCYNVEMDEPAKRMSKEFEVWATDQINSNSNEIQKQLWNRAHLKAVKLAALVAVGKNLHHPVVTVEDLDWAIRLVRQDIDRIAVRFEAGDVGEGESKQLADLKRVIQEYLHKELKEVTQFGTTRAMFDARVIPYKYLVRRLTNLAAFKRDRRGSAMAIKVALDQMIDAGELVEISKGQMREKFQNSQRAFAIGKDW